MIVFLSLYFSSSFSFYWSSKYWYLIFDSLIFSLFLIFYILLLIYALFIVAELLTYGTSCLYFSFTFVSSIENAHSIILIFYSSKQSNRESENDFYKIKENHAFF